MPKLSVAMTTYNGEKFVRRQLETLLCQTRRPDEVVIVDDQSTDRTAELVHDFIEQNRLADWRLIMNDQNIGFVRNFQKALSLTSGEIVFLCDQDDEWHEEKIERMEKRFEADETALAINSSFDLLKEAGGTTAVRGKNNYGLLSRPLRAEMTAIDLPQVIYGNISPGCTAAYRRRVVDAYLERSAGKLPHDYELNLIAAALGGLYFYDLPLIEYRLHGGNTIGLAAKERTRTEIAAVKLAAAEAVRAFLGGERLYRVALERMQALTSGGISAALRLWRYPEYYRYFSLRERIGDIVYLARRLGGRRPPEGNGTEE